MICRGLKKEDDNHTVVWFNSYGTNIIYPQQGIGLEDVASGTIITPSELTGNGQRIKIQGTLVGYSNYTITLTFPSTTITITGRGSKVNGYLVLPDRLESMEFDNAYNTLNITFFKYALSKKYKTPDLEDAKDPYYAKKVYLSYDEGLKSTEDSLIQRLSILKGELWYDINSGLPLLEKVKSKHLIDTTILSIVTNHPDVVRIINFRSTIEKHDYHCTIDVQSKYGTLNIIV